MILWNRSVRKPAFRVLLVAERLVEGPRDRVAASDRASIGAIATARNVAGESLAPRESASTQAYDEGHLRPARKSEARLAALPVDQPTPEPGVPVSDLASPTMRSGEPSLGGRE